MLMKGKEIAFDVKSRRGGDKRGGVGAGLGLVSG
jgi:hypothetical protein